MCTSSPEAPLKFKVMVDTNVLEWKSCNWVINDTETRCAIDGVFSTCLKTCQMCTSSPTGTPVISPPTDTPTKSPTPSPTKSPTESPTESPTKNPTPSPTKSPTPSPTQSPTKAPTCGSNDWTFKVDGQTGQGCTWVGNKPYQRCLVSTGAKENCKSGCCGISAAEPPTAAPPTSLCGYTNWSFKVNGQNGRGCGWVGNEAETRCVLEG